MDAQQTLCHTLNWCSVECTAHALRCVRVGFVCLDVSISFSLSSHTKQWARWPRAHRLLRWLHTTHQMEDLCFKYCRTTNSCWSIHLLHHFGPSFPLYQICPRSNLVCVHIYTKVPIVYLSTIYTYMHARVSTTIPKPSHIVPAQRLPNCEKCKRQSHRGVQP